MRDPYTILGVSSDASMEEIKKSYRTLSRKYHPDANINNPLKDEAEAKFKEIQQAYQQIVNERERGQSGNNAYGNAGGYGGFNGYGAYGGYSQGTQGNTDTSNMHLQAAAKYLQAGRYAEALNVLEGIKDRNALWYFYSASANSALGNNVTALEYARTAVSMEPNNPQYRTLLNNLENGGTWYHQNQNMYGYQHVMNTDMCSRICVTYIACNLCCGSSMCYGPGPYM